MRPGWDEYFMQIAHTVATRSTCTRASVGCVLTRDRRILTTGYNGAPSGVPHCSDVGCLLVNEHCQRATHAEANAIVQGALHGVSVAGAIAYCTHQPCVNCTKLLISAGIKKIVFDTPYPDSVATDLLREAGVGIVAFKTLEGVKA
jgi:dCMP deaminase